MESDSKDCAEVELRELGKGKGRSLFLRTNGLSNTGRSRNSGSEMSIMRKTGKWKDYLYGERAYIILSLMAPFFVPKTGKKINRFTDMNHERGYKPARFAQKTRYR